MASKGLRASWLPKLAAAINYKPQRLRNLLNKNDYHKPYRSELRALQILKATGVDFSKYVPTEDAVGVQVKAAPSATLVRGMKPNRRTGEEEEAPAVAEQNKRKHGKWSDRLLVSRLAKLLPGGITSANKNRVRYLLKKAGHPNIKEVDEVTALAVIEAEGVSVADFEFETKPGEPGGMLVRPPASTYESLREQYLEMGERLRQAVEEGKKYGEVRRLLETVKRILVSYETKFLPIAVKKFGGAVTPLPYPLDALNLIRDTEATWQT